MSNKASIERARKAIVELFNRYGGVPPGHNRDELEIANSGLELELKKLALDLSRVDVTGPAIEPVVLSGHLPPVLYGPKSSSEAKHFKPYVPPYGCTEVPRADYEALMHAFMSVVEELAITDIQLEERQAVIDLIPWCKAHGKGCLSHVKDWINSAAGYMGEEIEIDQTQLEFNSYTNGFAVRHRRADFEVRVGGGRTSHENRAACLRALQYHLKTSGEGRS